MADTTQNEPESIPAARPPVVVKKYANRRLYNTESSSYITLDTLAGMVREGRDFVVYDAKTGDDITRGVLTQIIVEQEGRGQNLLPTGFLRQLIGVYGDQVQGLLPRYLEQAMAAFAQQQEQMRTAMQKTMGSMGTLFPFGAPSIEEVSRQNLAMMERAMTLFAPFYRPGETPGGVPGGVPGGMPGGMPAGGPEPAAAPAPPPAQAAEIEALRAEVERLRHQLTASKPAKGSPVGR